MRDPEDFAGALNRAHELVSQLVQTYDNLNRYAKVRFGGAAQDWPPLLQPPPEPESQG
jgi:hypothetical protein